MEVEAVVEVEVGLEDQVLSVRALLLFLFLPAVFRRWKLANCFCVAGRACTVCIFFELRRWYGYFAEQRQFNLRFVFVVAGLAISSDTQRIYGPVVHCSCVQHL